MSNTISKLDTTHPFIKLFHTPNGAYLFDANKNEFISVSEESYMKLIHSVNNDYDYPEELSMLKKQGYIKSESNVRKISHVYSKYLSSFLDRKLSKITLQLTQNCNFRCNYCVYSNNHSSRQRGHSSAVMDWETAKKAIDFFAEHSVDSKKVNVGFYGGEPLLEYPLIEKTVEYCAERFRGKKTSFNVTTNGTLLTEEMIRFFDKNKISLLISLDGPREINDSNRVFVNGEGTYDAVLQNIELIKKVSPEYAKTVGINMVIDPKNDFDFINSIFSEEEFSEINIQPSIVEREYGDEKTIFSDEYIWKYEYQRFLSILSRFGRIAKDKVSPIADESTVKAFNDVDRIAAGGELCEIDAPSGPCVPGQLRLFVDVSGKLFPCERVSEKSPAMCLGNLYDGFDYENAQKMLNIGALTENACKNCWCFRYCTICAKQADSGAGELSAKEKLKRCRDIEIATYNALYRQLLLQEIPVFYAQQLRTANTL